MKNNSDIATSVQTVTETENSKINFIKMLDKIIRQRYIYLMVIPGVIWMIIFNYIPMYSVTIAFRDYNIVPGMPSPWVGLKHFNELFSDPDLPNIIKNTLGISSLRLLIGFPIPIIFALFLNEIRSDRFKRCVQTISYLPHFISWVILGGIMMNWLGDTGVINLLLINFHIIKEPVAFLAEPKYFWMLSVISDLWKELGWGAIIYLAAIAGIDQEMYEAAIVDGAGRFKCMWHITLPAIKGTIAMLFVLAVSGILSTNFDQIMVLRNSLNISASEVIDTFVYRVGIQLNRFSYSAALGLIKAVISLVLLLLANGVNKKLNDSSLF